MKLTEMCERVSELERAINNLDRVRRGCVTPGGVDEYMVDALRLARGDTFHKIIGMLDKHLLTELNRAQDALRAALTDKDRT